MKNLLSANERVLQALFEASVLGILVVDAQGTMAMANPYAHRLFGYSEGQLIGQPLERLIPACLKEKHQHLRKSFFADPRARPMGIGRRLHGLRQDGQQFPVEVSLSHMEVNGQQYAIAFITDVTEYKHTEHLNTLLTRIFQESLHAIYVMEATTFRFVRANQEALRSTGYPLTELQQRHPWDLSRGEDETTFRQRVAPLLAGEVPKVAFESVFVRQDGRSFPVEVHTQSFRYDAQPVLMQIVLDITERRKAEQAVTQALIEGQEAERRRVAQELHDGLGQSLTAIRLHLNALESDVSQFAQRNQRAFEKLKLILQTTTQEVKSISRDLMPQVLKDYGLVKALEFLCQTINDTNQVRLQLQVYGLEYEPDQPHKTGLYRVAQELINNALKHAQAQQIDVQLIGHASSVVLVVEDNGIGFDPSSDTTPVSRFGLRNVATRIRSLNGTFEVDTRPGEGTSVTVEIPLT